MIKGIMTGMVATLFCNLVVKVVKKAKVIKFRFQKYVSLNDVKYCKLERYDDG